MMVEFSVENCRSIKDEIILSMVASSDKSLKSNKIETEALTNDELLRSVALYGANASGKSNILLAISDLRQLVMTSHKNQKGEKLPYFPFKIDEDCKSKPTKIQIIFIQNKIRYIYGVSYTDDAILEEYLYYFPKGRRALIFERGQDIKDFKVAFDKGRQNAIMKQTNGNVLYLSRSTQLNYEKISLVFDWFKDTLFVLGSTNQGHLRDFTFDMLNAGDENVKKEILKALTEADLGIDDIRTETVSEEIKLKFPDETPNEVIDYFEQKIGQTTDFRKVFTYHKNVPFDLLSEESDGTKRMFDLVGPWIAALKNGKVLVVDELDTKLHHMLSAYLVKLFHDQTQNTQSAQLIFSNHDINLLDQELFRRDQIWFTEKNPLYGNTDLYSLVEFRQRKDADLKKGYLTGRYGALPFIKDNRIF